MARQSSCNPLLERAVVTTVACGEGVHGAEAWNNLDPHPLNCHAEVQRIQLCADDDSPAVRGWPPIRFSFRSLGAWFFGSTGGVVSGKIH